jgi:hypothetical protein
MKLENNFRAGMASLVSFDDLDDSDSDTDSVLPILNYDKYPRTEDLECM